MRQHGLIIAAAGIALLAACSAPPPGQAETASTPTPVSGTLSRPTDPESGQASGPSQSVWEASARPTYTDEERREQDAARERWLAEESSRAGEELAGFLGAYYSTPKQDTPYESRRVASRLREHMSQGYYQAARSWPPSVWLSEMRAEGTPVVEVTSLELGPDEASWQARAKVTTSAGTVEGSASLVATSDGPKVDSWDEDGVEESTDGEGAFAPPQDPRMK